ncbi:NAD(P)-dependent oxidoreductase [Rhodococcus sp. 15-649-1-2]|nr:MULTISPECIES: SDR family oxidoreductase [unclassified Rhodococcus (in: high G+C Gram-positive bacteria)]OZC76308.1 NAD(P)-dependent oxidoreductase [Rhodococcus sp. 06-418-1B]OZE80159.1 NAD(P)-dependent oxidoreductase [Rhodococcus sp. 15-649-1-2]
MRPYPFSDVSNASIAELLSLTGRRAVVTGAAQGLGRAIADRLAEAGADIVVIDLDGTAAAAVAEQLAEKHGINAVGIRGDVSDSASVVRAADHAVEGLGRIDIWVNNAGVFPNAPVLDMPDEMWDQVFAVNTRGVFVSSREAARRMPDGGVIVNVISTAGFKVGFPGMAAYASSKHAARGLTKALAVDLAPLGIRVLGVAPSYVPTEGNIAAAEAGAARAAAAGIELPELDVMKQSLIGRSGVPDDIARVVLFAASDLATIMTGSTLLADAGEAI